MAMSEAIAASCDTYFYRLGTMFYDLPPERGHPFQAWASRFGIGALTGVDIGPEEQGILPTPEWREATYTNEIDKLWKPGDSIQLTIGQKDVAVTPLQMARFFALVANGGKVVTPHVVAAVEKTGGQNAAPTVVRSFQPPPPVDSGVDPTAIDVIQSALYDATHAAYGTATSVFGNFSIPVAGKTGTAEKVVHAARLQLPAAARPVVVVRLRAGRQPVDRALRGHRERRPRRHRRGARGAQGVRALLPHEGAGHRRHREHRLMAEYVDTVQGNSPPPPAGAASRARRSGRSSPGSTGCCLPPRAALVAFGLWAISGITQSRRPGRAATTT